MDEYDFCACQHVFLEDRENDINFWFQKNRENHATKNVRRDLDCLRNWLKGKFELNLKR